MKGSQKIQVLYKGIMVCTRKKKLFEVFDFFTAQATEFALKAIEDSCRNGEPVVSICGTFGDKLQRELQVRLLD